MTTALLREFPYLRGKASFIDSDTFWHNKLWELFRNTRKRGDRTIPVVVKRQETFREEEEEEEEEDEEEGRDLHFELGIKNYRPDQCA